jgi:hypothetical protein
VSELDLDAVQLALTQAGVEVYRAEPGEIQIAERIRLHIMDSGVRLRVAEGYAVRFTARSQRSDFPHVPADELFHRVRTAVGSDATQRGYAEAAAVTVEVKDPVNDAKILDVWHEVTFEKTTTDLQEAIDEIRWALDVDKYIA